MNKLRISTLCAAALLPAALIASAQMADRPDTNAQERPSAPPARTANAPEPAADAPIALAEGRTSDRTKKDRAERRPPDHETRNAGSSLIVSVGGGSHDGGGVAVAADLVVTSAGLLDSCDVCAIRVGGGAPWRWADARRVPIDGDAQGLALLRVESGGLTPADLSPHRARRGEPLYAFPPSEGPRWLARRSGLVRTPSIDAEHRGAQWPGMLFTDMACADGTIGAGVYSGRTGRLLGVVFGIVDDPGSPANGLTATIGVDIVRDAISRVRPPEPPAE